VLRNSIYGQNDLIAKHGQKSEEDVEDAKGIFVFLLFGFWSFW